MYRTMFGLELTDDQKAELKQQLQASVDEILALAETASNPIQIKEIILKIGDLCAIIADLQLGSKSKEPDESSINYKRELASLSREEQIRSIKAFAANPENEDTVDPDLADMLEAALTRQPEERAASLDILRKLDPNYDIKRKLLELEENLHDSLSEISAVHVNISRIIIDGKEALQSAIDKLFTPKT